MASEVIDMTGGRTIQGGASVAPVGERRRYRLQPSMLTNKQWVVEELMAFGPIGERWTIVSEHGSEEMARSAAATGRGL